MAHASNRLKGEIGLTPAYERAMEAKFRNDAEAHTLLGLINAEFQSDPSSVACFDLRIVERVRECVIRYEEYRKKYLA